MVDIDGPREVVHHETGQRVGEYRYDVLNDDWTWGDEAYAIHGYQPGEVRVSTDLVLDHKHPEDRDRAGAVVRDAMLHAGAFSSYDRIITKDGDVRHVAVLGSGIVDEDDRVIAVEGYFIDLTTDVRRGKDLAADRAVQAASEHRAVIEQAKGMIMLIYSIDADAAFALLRWWSMERNVKVQQVAERLVSAATVHEVTEAAAKIRVDRLLQDITADNGA